LHKRESAYRAATNRTVTTKMAVFQGDRGKIQAGYVAKVWQIIVHSRTGATTRIKNMPVQILIEPMSEDSACDRFHPPVPPMPVFYLIQDLILDGFQFASREGVGQ
jgi:hypothetical protein